MPITETDVRDINGEQRVRDIRIGEVGGFVPPTNVRQVIENNIDELTQYGELCTQVVRTGGRPGTEYWLNDAPPRSHLPVRMPVPPCGDCP